MQETPIYALMSSISSLQDFEEFDQQTNLLRKTLQDILLQLPVSKRGIRSYQSVYYYPTGLCCWGKVQVILDPWQYEYPEEKQNKPRRLLSEVRNVCPFWYYQLLIYNHHKIPTAKNSMLFKSADAINQYLLLSEEEQKLVGVRQLNSTLRCAKEDFLHFFTARYRCEERVRNFAEYSNYFVNDK
jgi:hypothetical protein